VKEDKKILMFGKDCRNVKCVYNALKVCKCREVAVDICKERR
jgi:hypothetical protein